MAKKLTYEEVKNFIEVESGSGCKLLSEEYIRNNSKLLIMCKCGNNFKTEYTTFKCSNKRQCNKCSGKQTMTYYEVKKYIEIDSNSGCKLLTNTYKNNTTKLGIKCKCGEMFYTSFSKFKNRNKMQCNNCSGYTNWSFSKVKKYIESFTGNGCKLLTKEEDYENSMQLLDVQCKCGDTFITKFIYFKYDNKKQCDSCGIAMRSGENSPLWKGGTSSERDIIKNSEEYRKWRKSIYERDKYTCQCCGDNKGHNLHAHHIANFSNNIALRIDVNNGITLCNDCHNPSVSGSFHHTYGTKDNTREQLEEYIEWYREDVARMADLLD